MIFVKKCVISQKKKTLTKVDHCCLSLTSMPNHTVSMQSRKCLNNRPVFENILKTFFGEKPAI